MGLCCLPEMTSTLEPSEQAFSFMQTRLPIQDSYTFDDLSGIAARCECFIHDKQVLQKVPHPQTIFVSMEKIEAFHTFVDRILPTLQHPFVVVIASKDRSFPLGVADDRFKEMSYRENQRRYQSLMKNPHLRACFVENLDKLEKKLHPLPLGLLKEQQDIQVVKSRVLKDKPLKALCIHRFHVGGAWDTRRLVSRYASNYWRSSVLHKKELSRNEFLAMLKKYPFCICVHGGGIDPSPKAWEALAMGCIPIIEHSTLDAAYSLFPVAYVKSWQKTSINKQRLEKWLKDLRPFYENPSLRKDTLNKLGIDFWWHKILKPLS